jgi:hypothetical protein
MAWLPDYGVGMFAMANLTYVGPAEPIGQAWDVLLKTGGLRKRELPASPILAEMRGHIWNLWKSWDDSEAKQIAAMNLFLDAPAAQRRAEIQKLKDDVGECSAAGPLIPENWLRGQFNLTCAKGMVGVFFTLSPTQPPDRAAPGFPQDRFRERTDGCPDGRSSRRRVLRVAQLFFRVFFFARGMRAAGAGFFRPDPAFFSIRSFHAVRRAPARTSSVAAVSLI